MGVLTLNAAVPAGAAGNAYGAWTLAGANPSWTGTMSVGAAGFPSSTYATSSGTPSVESGASAFLGASTPFGAVFGSTANQPYLTLRTAAGASPSTTTFTFASPVPAGGWGFALGDVDVDRVQIEARGADGQLVPVAALGHQGEFNACQNVPKPSSCASGVSTDVPTWDPATATLIGSGSDTTGASGWFRPVAPVSALTFTFTRITGAPVFQLWFAALTADISGTVTNATTAGSTEPTPAALIALLDPAGDPVVDAAGDPVTTTAAADGSWTIPAVLPTELQIRVDPPPGRADIVAVVVDVDASDGDVSGVDANLPLAAPATTTTSSTSTTTSTTTTTRLVAVQPAATSSGPMARTGSESAPLAGIGLGAVVGGLVLLGARRVRLRRVV